MVGECYDSNWWCCVGKVVRVEEGNVVLEFCYVDEDSTRLHPEVWEEEFALSEFQDLLRKGVVYPAKPVAAKGLRYGRYVH